MTVRRFHPRWVETVATSRPQQDFWERGRPGFGLRVTSAGRKTWQAKRQTTVTEIGADGKARRRTRQTRVRLGRFQPGHPQHLSLAEARAAWEAERYRGRTPARPHVRTVADLAGLFLAARPEHKRAADASRLNRHVLPYVGQLPLRDLRRGHLLELLNRVADRPVEARCVLSLLRMLFRHGVQLDLLGHSPAAEIAAPRLPPPRTRVLGADELVAVWRACERLHAEADDSPEGQARRRTARAEQLRIVTLARQAEICRAQARDLHEDPDRGRYWLIPAETTKAGRQALARGGSARRGHVVPLCSLAAGLFDDLVALQHPRTDLLVTAARSWHRPRREWTRAERRLLVDYAGIPYWQSRDLRRSAATWLQELGVDEGTVALLLHHSTGEAPPVTGVYARGWQFERRRAALEKLDAFVRGLLEGKVASVHRFTG